MSPVCAFRCGTGEFIWQLKDDFDRMLGVDLNPNFLEHCRQLSPHMLGDDTLANFVCADATDLRGALPASFGSSGTRIVTCVGNTIGIIPESARRKVYQEMVRVAGEGGLAVMIYWNAAHFGNALQHFYHANPSLCGPLAGAVVDYNLTKLSTKSGYSTKWTSLAEARQILAEYGLVEVVTEEKGKGVFIAFR